MADSLPLELAVPTTTGTLNLQFEFGGSTVIIGANGSGKTRLGVWIEEGLVAKDIVHRIAAQKILSLDDVQLIQLELAETILRYGQPNALPVHKRNYRWQNKPATQQLNDFGALLQTLFAQHNRVAVRFLDEYQEGGNLASIPTTVLQQVQRVWERLLPHRRLQLLEAAIRARPATATPSPQVDAPQPDGSYRAAEMSDGERAIFYLLGQCFIARKGSILIIDEPEAHIHKAIVNKVWDAIEAERPDCAFVYFTHDLDFASRRAARAKYFIRSFARVNSKDVWDIERIPTDSGLPAHVVSEIVGSRQPILFVEGTGSSLDIVICRGIYSEFTVIPVGSCEDVIHCVESFARNPSLHASGTVQGLVDADGRSAAEIALLAKLHVQVLPVAEIENLLLLPGVFLALATALHHSPPAPEQMLSELTNRAMRSASEQVELISSRHSMRQLDAMLKRVGLAAKDLPTLQASYLKEIAAVNPGEIFAQMKQRIEKTIQDRDLATLLSIYDNKGLLAEAASILRLRNKSDLEDLTSRLLSAKRGQQLREALALVMPTIA